QWIGEQILDNNNGWLEEEPEEEEFSCWRELSLERPSRRLSKQMHDRYSTEKKMAKILRQDELRKNGQEFDITALDSAVKANRSKSSKMMRLITDLRKNQNRRAEELRR
nr:hypothetical protein [Tanacetum cinerariifolium]